MTYVILSLPGADDVNWTVLKYQISVRNFPGPIFRPSSSKNSSVHLSVRLSHLFYNVPIIVPSWNFQEFLPVTKVMSMQKVRGQRSKLQRSKQILPQFRCCLTVTPVWIHRWLQNNAQSLKWPKRGALLIFKVIHQISRSHRPKNRRLSASGLWLQFQFTNGYKIMHKSWSGMEEEPYSFLWSSIKFQGHRGP